MLTAAGVDGHTAENRQLANRWISLSGSAVGDGSAATYAAARARFVRFVTGTLRKPADAAFPRARGADLNRTLVCLFLTHAADTLAPSTLRGTLSALADWQRDRGLPAGQTISQDPSVKRTLAQILRRKAAAGDYQPPLQKAPLPVGLLRLLLGWVRVRRQGREAEAAQDLCWLVVGFFGMLRRSELAALTVGDVELLPGGGVELRIRRSKGDQFGVGARVALAAVTASSQVPIGRIVREHLSGLPGAPGDRIRPLFWRKQGRGKDGAKAWDKAEFTKRLRGLLAGLDRELPSEGLELSLFTAHSLRRGGATAAANAGVSVEEIMAHGRWKSAAVREYIKRSVTARMGLVQRM